MLLSIVILLIVASIVGSLGSLFLKIGSDHIITHGGIKKLLLNIKNYKLLLGILLYALSSVFFIFALRLGDLSVVYPMTSLTYVFITILSSIYLKEKITKYKIAGVGFIIFGVVLVTL